MKKKLFKKAVDNVFKEYYDKGLTATAAKVKANLLTEINRLDKRY